MNRIIVLLGFILISITGCSVNKEVVSGIVGGSDTVSSGVLAPDIPIITTGKEYKTLNEIRHPITAIVFIDTPGEDNYYPSSELVKLAHHFQNYFVSVVQVSLPDKTFAGQTKFEKRSDDPFLNMLSDPDRIAWKLYKQPKSGTVIIIDEEGKIAHIDDLKNIDAVTEKLDEMLHDYFTI